MVLDSGASKSWNNGDELLKKFIGGSPDGEIDGCGNPEWTRRSQIEHGSSAEAGICRGVIGMTYLTSPERSRQIEVVVRILTTPDW